MLEMAMRMNAGGSARVRVRMHSQVSTRSVHAYIHTWDP